VGLLYWKKGAGARRNINFRFPVTYFAKAPQVIKPGMTECGECGNDRIRENMERHPIFNESFY
jgi:hypothetical protein